MRNCALGIESIDLTGKGCYFLRVGERTKSTNSMYLTHSYQKKKKCS